MVSVKTKPPSFFKIFFGFSSKLRIPSEFVKKYRKMLPQISLLQIESGQSWNVKIKSMNDHFYLTDGWPDFVKDNVLTKMDFLVFHLVSKSTCKVTIYGVEGCPKDDPHSSPVSDNINTYTCNDGQISQRSGKDIELLKRNEPGFAEENHESNGDQLTSRSKSFEAVIKKHNKYFMDIPKAFALETGIARKREIKLGNTEGEEWVVKILKTREGTIHMTRGWNEFRVKNKLIFRSQYSFEFDSAPGNLIVKRGWEILTNISSATRKRGRPPKNIIGPEKTTS